MKKHNKPKITKPAGKMKIKGGKGPAPDKPKKGLKGRTADPQADGGRRDIVSRSVKARNKRLDKLPV
jgi:hypothetical protein